MGHEVWGAGKNKCYGVRGTRCGEEEMVPRTPHLIPHIPRTPYLEPRTKKEKARLSTGSFPIKVNNYIIVLTHPQPLQGGDLKGATFSCH